MRRLVVSPAAERAFLGVIRHSRRTFGAEIANRYRWLIQRGYFDLRIDPERAGVRAASGTLFTYHLRHSRLGIPAPDRIGRPRHLLVFRFDDERVEIVRILHDSMDLDRRLGRERRR